MSRAGSLFDSRNGRRREEQRRSSRDDRGGHGRSLTPRSSHDSYGSHQQQQPRQQRHDHNRDYAGTPQASVSTLDVDPVADRQRERKARRRQERLEKKQSRILKHERWVQRCQQTRQEARERRAAEPYERERKRQRAGRAATSRDAKDIKRHKVDAASKDKGAMCVPGTDSVLVKRKKSLAGLKADAAKSSAGSRAVAGAEPATASVVAAAFPASSPADTTAVPPQVTEKVRRFVNKLTTANVVDLTKDLSDYMLTPGVSRASVVKGLAQQIERLCRLEAGPLSTTGTLPFAGLLRGMQLLHGSQVGSELVERVSLSLKAQLAAAEEAAAGNTLMVLAQLYLLYGVDVVFIMSLLRTLLRQGTRLMEQGEGDSAKASTSSSSPNAGSVVAVQAVCACACGLALMRACGEKLLKESPAELEASLQVARRASAEMRNITGTARFAALVEVMSDIASGRTCRARRTTTEVAAPVEAMLEDLCSLLPGQEKATATQRRTMKRLVLTTNIMSGLTWLQVTSSAKPPRWYMPGVMMDDALSYDAEGDYSAAASATTPSGRISGIKEDGRSCLPPTSHRLSTGDDESEPVDEVDEVELKRERVARMRTEEKALNGQRLHTEHKRDIFKCIASATDDLECFTMLMYRDPRYTRFHDVCAVLLQCSCQERRYNPYYVQVLMRFCSAKSACVKTLQFAIWDRFKAIRIEGADVIGYFNFSCCIADLMEHNVYNLGLLRGLDLENTNKTIGLFTRILLLRLIFQLSASRLTQLFFGGDGRSAHDLQVDTSALRQLLIKFMSLYFVDENVSKRWLPNFFDVVAAGTSFDGSAAAEPQAALAANADGDAAKALIARSTAVCRSSALPANASAPSHVALSTPNSFSSTDVMLEQFMKRVQVVYKALKQGIS
ncbi:hypothetical protein JKF63_02914 [Porcisia hertigi]|uniref:MI domain-containing protein n=1 Tax=Porcisia hertigi TaxID=2761500 RepID=A0A836INB5_9TRYP|nr:hypothetical protein JKF63_02914 [Porcisia hertigi]